MTPKRFALGFLAIFALSILGYHAANAATMVCVANAKVDIINGPDRTAVSCPALKTGKAKVRKVKVVKQKTAAVVGTTPLK